MTPLFLAGAAVLALLVTTAVVWPLLRRAGAAPARRDYDLAIYRDQLAEIDRDRRRGVIDAAEAEASRLEVQRRLLAADRSGGAEGDAAGAGVARRDWFLPAAIALLVPGLALGLYLMIGRPDLPSIGFAEQQAAVADMSGLTAKLRQRLEAEPANPQGWELLGRSYQQLGRPDLAADAFRQALQHGGDPGRLEAALGEALVAAAEGRVGPEARAAFARALEADPGEPRARYYAGLALVQDGRTEEGLEVWRRLAEASPPDAPWLPSLNQSIAAVSGQAGGETGEGAMPGPTQRDVEAAGEMSQEERSAFVRSMVERLAARLEEEPGDVEGWLRLARARQVLGETEAAVAALRSAQAQLAGRPAEDAQRRRVEEALRGLGQEP